MKMLSGLQKLVSLALVSASEDIPTVKLTKWSTATRSELAKQAIDLRRQGERWFLGRLKVLFLVISLSAVPPTSKERKDIRHEDQQAAYNKHSYCVF